MRILLIGGTSYVAAHVIEASLRRGWSVLAVSRNRVSEQILVPGDGGRVVNIPPDEVGLLGSVDAIVNFAYPRGLGLTRVHGATLQLMNSVADAARRLAPRVVVHVSTQSVFGYTITREPRPVPVWWAAGESYVETKALAEWLFLLRERRAPYAKVVLRLGNVIGPGAYWIAELARRMLFGEPLGRGASNATHVANVADYICHLVTTEPAVLRAFGPFHHLAELSSYTWDKIADRLASTIGTQALYRDSPAPRPQTALRDLARTGIRFSAMFLPEAALDPIDRLQEWRYLRRFPPGYPQNNEAGDHPTLHQTGVFRSHTLPGWTPKVDIERAIEETSAWMLGAGYALSRRTG